MYSSKNITINGLGIFIGRATGITVTFIVTPIVISSLGIAGYGAWETIISLSVICNILQTIVATSALWLISSALGQSDTNSAQQYVRMAIFVCLLQFCIMTPLVWIFRQPLADFLSLSYSLRSVGYWLLPCMVGLTLLGSVNEVMVSFIAGFQRSGSAALISATSVIIGNIIIVVMMVAGLGYLGMLVGYVLTLIVAFGGLFIMARRIVPNFTILPRIPSLEVLHKCGSFAAFMLLGVIASLSREQADKLIMATTATSVWVGYYGIASRLTNLVLVVCSSLYVPTMAAVGLVSVSRSPGQLDRIYNDVCTITILSVGLAVVIVGGLSNRLIVLWIGSANPEMESIVHVMLFGIAMASMLTGCGTAICKGLGILHIELKYIIISLAGNAVLKALLIPIVGAMGSVIASYLSWGLASIVFICLFHRATGITKSPSYRLAGALAIAALSIGIARYTSGLMSTGTDRLAQVLPIALIGAMVSVLFVVLSIMTGVIPRDIVNRLIDTGRVKIGRG
jgi:O-antigen/teichoic acid export membrane protein